MSKKKREICEFEINVFEEFFCLRSNISNDNVISAKSLGLKTGVVN